jgi:hypothetical protein
MMWDPGAFLSSAFLLTMVMDPLGNIPMCISALKDVPLERRRIVLARELTIALGISDNLRSSGAPPCVTSKTTSHRNPHESTQTRKEFHRRTGWRRGWDCRRFALAKRGAALPDLLCRYKRPRLSNVSLCSMNSQGHPFKRHDPTPDEREWGRGGWAGEPLHGG